MGLTDTFGSFSNEILIALIVLVVIYVGRIVYENSRLPPGPHGLPIIGYLPYLTKYPHLQFQELAKHYGDMFSLRLGTANVLVLNSAEVIRNVYSMPETLGRPENNIFSITKILETPFFTKNNEIWYEHRRFALHALRDLGFGKSIMHDLILEEIQFVLKKIGELGGKSCNVKDYLTPSTSNNICSLIFGKRYNYDDPERLLLDDALNNVTKLLTQTTPLIFLKFITRIPFVKWVFGFDEFGKKAAPLLALISKKIEEHKKTLDPDHIRDFIDSYLCELKARQKLDPNTAFNEAFLKGMSINFFGAGSETVRTSVDWLLYTMAAYPEVQKTVQAELDSVVGRERNPTYPDSKNLPYTMSLLKEMMRWKTVAPISPLRSFLHDATVNGYHIPKGTLIMANLWAAHHNPKDWKDPDKFVPERFLSTDKKSLIKSENLLPFSHGKRACPGEGLAVTEVYLYFTSILQKYSIHLPEGEKPNFEGDLSITFHLKPRQLCFLTRV